MFLYVRFVNCNCSSKLSIFFELFPWSIIPSHNQYNIRGCCASIKMDGFGVSSASCEVEVFIKKPFAPPFPLSHDLPFGVLLPPHNPLPFALSSPGNFWRTRTTVPSNQMFSPKRPLCVISCARIDDELLPKGHGSIAQEEDARA